MDIQEHNIWTRAARLADGVLYACGFGHKLEVIFAGDHEAKPPAEHRVIIDDHDAQGAGH
jgi:hypothetical protein